MIWLVWNNDGESEADAKRIDAQDCIEAAEEWARLDDAADPANHEQHLKGRRKRRRGFDLRARPEGHEQIHRIHVGAESPINCFGSEGS